MKFVLVLRDKSSESIKIAKLASSPYRPYNHKCGSQYQLFANRPSYLISQRIDTSLYIFVFLFNPYMSFRYFDQATIYSPLNPLILFSNYSSEYNFIQLCRVSDSHNLILKFFIRGHHLCVENAIGKWITSLSQHGIHCIIAYSSY